MGITIAVSVSGTNQAKFYRNLPLSAAKGADRGAKVMTENILTQMKMNAPKDRGKLSEALKMKSLGRQTGYQIYVGSIQPWGSRKSRKARKVYPIAQERGYRGHWVKTTMFPKDSKIRQDLEARDIGRAFVRKFTPFMLPTLIQNMVKNQKAMAKEMTREYSRLKRKSQYTSGKRLNPINFGR